MQRFYGWLRKASQNKSFLQGGQIQIYKYKFPFQQDMRLLVSMFEVRKWFMNNSPHTRVSTNYSDDMPRLHNELNYLHSRIYQNRNLFLMTCIAFYTFVIYEQRPVDWKEQFAIKNEKDLIGRYRKSTNAPPNLGGGEM